MSTKLSAKLGKRNTLQTTPATIHACLEASKGGDYIFRGVNRQFRFKSSGLKNTQTSKDCVEMYSTLCRKTRHMKWDGVFSPFSIESEIVRNARSYFPSSARNIDILTELRHFGQELALIDFTRNIYVALFFACYGEFDKPGELIIFKCPVMLDQVDYDDSNLQSTNVISTIVPSHMLSSQKRVLAQSSIFVRTPMGYIDGRNYSDNELKIITITADEKKTILDYLLKNLDISYGKIYNDVAGFINFQIKGSLLRIGSARNQLKNNKSKPAERKLIKLLDNDPHQFEALCMLADIYYRNGEMNKETEYLNKAISVNRSSAESLYLEAKLTYNKGMSKFDEGMIIEADKLLKAALTFVTSSLNLNDKFLPANSLKSDIEVNLQRINGKRPPLF